MEERFPEYDEWRAAGIREREEHRRQLEAVADDPRATLLWTLERARDYFLPHESEEKTPAVSQHAPVDKLLRGGGPKPVAERVGRNAPCPCGSGRKFKNCCMKKSS